MRSGRAGDDRRQTWSRGGGRRLLLLAAMLVPVAVPVALAAGGGQAGSLYAFGSNYEGQLGNTVNVGDGHGNPTPATVTLPGGVGSVRLVAVGAADSLAVTSTGQLYAFGDNPANTAGPHPVPALVALPGRSGAVTAISSSSAHALVVTASGQLYAFGENVFGELGIAADSGTTTPHPTPTLVTLPGLVHSAGVVTPAGRGATQVAAGSNFSLVAVWTGRLYAFGNNHRGQLGNATNDNADVANPTPTLVTLPGQVGAVTDLAAGSEFSLAVTSSGQLYAFGVNTYGQLGNATNNGGFQPNPTPTLVTLPGELGGVVEVAAGYDHSLAVTSSGQLYAFGSNDRGQLGNGTGLNGGSANPVPTLVSLPGQVGGVVTVSAGIDDSLAVTSSGQLYAFGDNIDGQLGNSTNIGTDSANPTPSIVALPEGTTIETVARGDANHTVAITSDLAVATASLPAAEVGATYTTTLAASGGAPPYRWAVVGLPTGLTLDPSTGTISGATTTPAPASLAVTVTDAGGIEASRTLTLASAASATTTTTTTSAAPLITAVSQTHRRWRRGRKAAAIATAHRAPIGTTFALTVDQPARIDLVFTQLQRGRRVNGRCAARGGGNRGRPSCARGVVRGSLMLAGHAGADRIAFQGRLGNATRLRPGGYTVAITATNVAGGRSASHMLSFTIVR